MYEKKKIKLEEYLKEHPKKAELARKVGKKRSAIDFALNSEGGHFVRINENGYFLMPMMYWEAVD